MLRALRLMALPALAGVVLWADLSNSGYLKFSIPLPELRGQIQAQSSKLWQTWRTDGIQAISLDDARLEECQELMGDKPISRGQYLQLDELVGQTADQVALAMGNPNCLLADGRIRYVGDFLSTSIDLDFDEDGRLIRYELND